MNDSVAGQHAPVQVLCGVLCVVVDMGEEGVAVVSLGFEGLVSQMAWRSLPSRVDKVLFHLVCALPLDQLGGSDFTPQFSLP